MLKTVQAEIGFLNSFGVTEYTENVYGVRRILSPEFPYGYETRRSLQAPLQSGMMVYGRLVLRLETLLVT